MSSHVTVSPDSARRREPLGGAWPDDWALTDDRELPTYEAALERAWFEPGWRAGAGPGTLAGPEREPELKNAIVDGLALYGRNRLENECHYLIARA